MTCPECELNKARAALWRHEAYKLGGTPLPWDVDVVIAKAVAAERERCAQICEDHSSSDGDWCAQQIRGPLSNMSKKNKRPLPYEPDPR